MTTIAALGLEVKSDQVLKGAKSLDQLSESAVKAQKAQERIAAQSRKLEATQLRMANAQDKYNKLMAQGPQPIERTRAALASLKSAESNVIAVQAQLRASNASLVAANDAVAASNNRVAISAKGSQVAQAGLVTVSKAAAFRQRQLAVQSLDVAQSLALGMPPMMVAIQQGGQLAGIYAGQGGITGAFKEAGKSVLNFARKHPVLLAATAAIGAGFAGIRHEINKTSETQVSFGNVMQATMNVVARTIVSKFAPIFNTIQGYVAPVYDWLVSKSKTVGNLIIKAFRITFNNTKTIFVQLPNIVGAAAIGAANLVIKSVDSMIKKIRSGVDGLIGLLNKIPNVDIPSLGPGGEGIGEITNPFADRLRGAFVDMAAANAQTMASDPLGSLFSSIKEESIRLAKEGLDKTAKAATSAGDALKSAANKGKDAWSGLRKATVDATQPIREFGRDLAGGFLSDLQSGLKNGEGLWKSFGNAALNALNKITDKLLNEVLDAVFQVGSATSGASGGGGGGFFGAIFKGITGLFGGFRADGGSVASGKSYIVGERGPELFSPGASGFVTPNHALSQQTANSNAPQDMTVHVHLTSDNEMFEAKVISISSGVSQQHMQAAAKSQKIARTRQKEIGASR